MSRTIRRKNVHTTGKYYGDERSYTYDDDAEHAKLHGGWKSWQKYDWTTRQYVGEIHWHYHDVAWGGRKSVPKKGKEYRKGWWTYHGDSIRFNSGAKGPGWWITEFVQRPYRQAARRQIQKWMKDEDYEVIIQDKPKRMYWD
jgi:hypothetical protein